MGYSYFFMTIDNFQVWRLLSPQEHRTSGKTTVLIIQKQSVNKTEMCFLYDISAYGKD